MRFVLVCFVGAISVVPVSNAAQAQLAGEWVQIVRIGRPRRRRPKERIIKNGKFRRASQVASAQPRVRGPPPEEVLANARARVTKLEAAMAAVGEADPAFSTLQEALRKAKSGRREDCIIESVHRTGEEEDSLESGRGLPCTRGLGGCRCEVGLAEPRHGWQL